MTKSLRLILLLILIIAPIVFYKSLNKKNSGSNIILPLIQPESEFNRPQIALIFDGLGESLKDLREIYSLDIPLTISVIPNLKFSRNIAHIGARSGFSVLIHLPLEPLAKSPYSASKYKFISADLSKWEIDSLLRQYLNFIRIAIGVNNYMGSGATQDQKLMKTISRELKRRNLIFIDSRTSLESVAYQVARQEGLVCGYNEGFLDSIDSVQEMERRLENLITAASQKGKIIVIAHPKKNTIKFLKDKLPALKERVEFVTIREYFGL